nr:MAG TPA: hypothetical protein [Caudoviricetes sp.]
MSHSLVSMHVMVPHILRVFKMLTALYLLI